jgi:ribosomal protein S18 acetylase RimI-like enzyme
MKSYSLREESDIQLMRDLIARLPHKSTIVDFEETMLLASVRGATRLWQDNGRMIGFAYVDDYNNLRFEIDTQFRSVQLEDEIMAWGVSCVKNRNAQAGTTYTLDAAFSTHNTWQIAMLKRGGFVRADQRTLRYARPLNEPIEAFTFPPGFHLRNVAGADEVERVVALHRAAFGTENMTVDQRMAMMRTPGYERELDLVAVTAEGELAAFCVCGIENEIDDDRVGFTDPIGVHPAYQHQGLGKAIVTAGLYRLRDKGIRIVRLSTSSANVPMQRLAQTLGFSCESEKLWFSKVVA